LQTERLVLRRWQSEDRAPFAAMNADPEVMHHFRGPLDRAQSDAFLERIEQAFETHGYGLWVVELRSQPGLLGFAGLAWQTFEAAFTPALEVGWRFARSAWGHGYATEAGRAALAYGFEHADVDEIVSMTTRTNERSQAVMRRLGLTRDPNDDFEHPALPPGHPLRPHVLYRISRPG
jgi:RimJ/RimL family protein N-acetyltransferase